jgi:hypothetical protein
MRLAGFNFKKISAEKLSDKTEGVKLNANIDVAAIEEIKSSMFQSKESLLGIKFSYVLDYKPDFAKIDFRGDLILSVDPKQAKTILKDWETKKLDDDFRIDLFNIILRKSGIRALELENELNIPLHMPMQQFKKPDEK